MKIWYIVWLSFDMTYNYAALLLLECRCPMNTYSSLGSLFTVGQKLILTYTCSFKLFSSLYQLQ